MITVDASVWVSYFLPKDENHSASFAWVEHQMVRREALQMPVIGLAEVAGAVARRTGQTSLGLQALEYLLRGPGLVLVNQDVPSASSYGHVAAERRLRGMDAIYLAVAMATATPLVTWDKQQLEGGAAVVPTRTPVTDS